MNEEKRPLLTKEQALVTGSTLLASGILDVATDFKGLAVFAGAAGVFLAYRHGSDLLDHFVPGRHNAQALEATAHFVDAVAAQPEGLDQSAPAKLRRLVGMKPSAKPSKSEPKNEQAPNPGPDALGEMEPLQPAQPPTDIQSLLPRRSPTFVQMRHLITPGRDILGFDGQQLISAESLKQSVNFAMIGVPGSGKTCGLAFHSAQAIARGAIVRGWDLHGDVAADLGGVLHILEDVDEIIADCYWLQAERERRLALRKRMRAGESSAKVQWDETRELFYVVDEFNALMLRLKKRPKDRELVADTLLSLIAEGRKFKMRVIITGQTMPAALFGDQGSSARDIINTKYALQSRDNHAHYFGIEPKAIETLLPLISGKDSAGYAVLDGGPLSHAILVSIPYTTVEDIRALIEQYGNHESEEEDDLMAYITNRHNNYEREERETDPVIQTPTRYHGHATGRDAQVQRRAEREQRLRGASVGPVQAREQQTAQPTASDAELARGIDAYQRGARTIDDFQAAMGLQTQHQARILRARVKMAMREDA